MNDKETCSVCNNPGEYWEWRNGILLSICRKHLKVEASS